MFNAIHDVIADISKGRMVIVIDDEDRENEGDLIMAGSFVQLLMGTFVSSSAQDSTLILRRRMMVQAP